MKKLLKVIAIILLLNSSYGCLAQNVKKIYKNIKSDNILEAFNELSKIEKGNKKFSSVELNEISIATNLIFSNIKFDECEPYEELLKFNQLVIPSEDMPEIIEFLKKFDYTFDKILDIIYENIALYSKKINTEEGYNKALKFCVPCIFNQDLKDLKELAAYNESKTKNSTKGYKYFLNEYKNSSHRVEIFELLENKTFEDAKNIKSLYSLNDFISKYPKSKFNEEAVDIRDLIALPKEPMSFDSVSDYIKTYPNSKFTSKLKLELPNILYNKVVSENTIEIIKKFIILYPNDKRVEKLKSLLEISYVDVLKNNFNIDDYNYFKNMFPNSQYLKELNIIFIQKKKNSDIAVRGLRGNVKSINTLVSEGKDGDILVSFDAFGKTKEIILKKPYRDPIEMFEIRSDPKEFDREYGFLSNTGYEYGSVYCDFQRDSSLPFDDIATYTYDTNGNLIYISGTRAGAINLTYDVEQNLVSRESSYVFKYKWKNKKLISKIYYDNDGNPIVCYDIHYNENTQFINRYCDNTSPSIETPNETFIITFDKNGRVTNKTRIATYYDALGAHSEIQYKKNYFYTDDYLTRISGDEHNEGAYSWGRNGKYLNETIDIIINRDHFGNITSLGNSEFLYKYDESGNWTLRTEYNIIKGDIIIRKKIKEISRIIQYY